MTKFMLQLLSFLKKIGPNLRKDDVTGLWLSTRVIYLYDGEESVALLSLPLNTLPAVV